MLDEWAAHWGIPRAALDDLAARMTADAPPGVTGGSEAGAQVAVRLEASRKGCRLWRNNVGACMDDKGHFVRYGLANESKQMNARVKSSDLVGIRPVLITPAQVGQTIGQFICREIKALGWHYTGNKHERAQANWLALVNSLGGDAQFTTGEGSL